MAETRTVVEGRPQEGVAPQVPGDPLPWSAPVEPPVSVPVDGVALGALGPTPAWPVRPGAPEPPTRSSAALRDAAQTYAAVHGGAHGGHPRRRLRWSVSWRLAGVAGLAVLLLAGGVALRAASAAPGAPVALPVPVPDGSPPPTTAPSVGADTVVVVDVVGAVGTPGVVRLPAGSRVVDAVTAAGGPTADAQVGGLNLARLLVDGEQIVVPQPGQTVPVVGPSAEPTDERVDLNTADAAALDALPGIGPVLAARIVAHRDDGPYTSVDELGDVSGIGPTLLDRLRDLVRV